MIHQLSCFGLMLGLSWQKCVVKQNHLCHGQEAKEKEEGARVLQSISLNPKAIPNGPHLPTSQSSHHLPIAPSWGTKPGHSPCKVQQYASESQIQSLAHQKDKEILDKDQKKPGNVHTHAYMLLPIKGVERTQYEQEAFTKALQPLQSTDAIKRQEMDNRTTELRKERQRHLMEIKQSAWDGTRTTSSYNKY